MRQRKAMRDTVLPMPENTSSRDGSTITVRLDSRTGERLRVVAELLTERDALGREVTVSQVVRAGIDAMWERHANDEAGER
jgi:hypothetical protein